MKIKKLFASVGILSLVLCIGCASLLPSSASASFASLCSGFSRLNRPGCFGYFAGQNFYSPTNGIQGQNIIDCTKAPSVCVGGESINNAIPAGVTNAATFISFMQGYLGSGTGYDYNKAGAAFVIDAMLGRWGTDYGSNVAGIAYAQAHFAQWAAAVSGYDSKGWVTWSLATTLPPGTINSLHACWPSVPSCTPANISAHDSGDFAFFRNPSPEASHVIIFRNPDGSTFEIRRECANLFGSISPLALPDYSLTAAVSATVNGGGGGPAEPGDSVQFNYTVTNSALYAASNPASCTIYAINRAGYVSGSPPPGPGDPSQNLPCPPIAAGSQYTVPATGTYALLTAAANTTYCRLLVVSPSNPAGATSQFEVCVQVISKPYVKVFGGDVSAGNGFGTGCTEDTNAAVVGWNKRVGSFAGAGTEYAAYVLNTLQDFGTAQNGAPGGALTPTGLAFSNQGTSQANGLYGTSIGPSLPCQLDYASMAPAGDNKVGAPGPGGLDISTLPNGASTYTGGGNLTIKSSTLGAGQNIVLYVNGNVYINGNVLYGGSWTVDQIPNLQLVVSGNIYVGGAVSELDGNYIAQASGGAGGTIYTCTDAASPFTAIPLTSPGNTIYNTCSAKLTVNGSFTAQQVELLRTNGTLAQSSPAESSGSNAAAESFSYNPSLWIAQPQAGSSSIPTTDDYDSIVSLPPVL